MRITLQNIHPNLRELALDVITANHSEVLTDRAFPDCIAYCGSESQVLKTFADVMRISEGKNVTVKLSAEEVVTE